MELHTLTAHKMFSKYYILPPTNLDPRPNLKIQNFHPFAKLYLCTMFRDTCTALHSASLLFSEHLLLLETNIIAVSYTILYGSLKIKTRSSIQFGFSASFDDLANKLVHFWEPIYLRLTQVQSIVPSQTNLNHTNLVESLVWYHGIFWPPGHSEQLANEFSLRPCRYFPFLQSPTAHILSVAIF